MPISPIAAAIRRYLDTHPNAVDTAGGISRWWLSAMHVEASPSAVSAALEELMDLGAVEKRVMASGEIMYGARLGQRGL